ncbi:MAG: trigger factor [Campylobacter sp.]|nr:trigger factor [Campylobacter sp.]
MEVNSQLLNSANATIDVKIDRKAIDDKILALAKNAAKQVKIDGFRPGKVPVSVVLKRYKSELEKDAKQELIKEAVDEGLKAINKKSDDILGEPVFGKLDDKDALEASIEVSFRPEISVDGYEEIIPTYSTPRVTKKEIEEKVNEFLKVIAPIQKIEKEILEKGDYAKFDFEGFVDGVAFDGGKAKDFVLEIGSNQFIPGFEDGMVGLKVGEEKDINVKFPDNYNAKNLAGKDAVFKVKLSEIQAKNVVSELTDEILRKNVPNEKDITKEIFEGRIKDGIREDKFQKLLNDELKPKFADSAVEKFSFDLPKNIVEQEMNLQFNAKWQTFSPEEMAKFREDKDALTNEREKLRKDAEKSVKLTFIVDELAKLRGIEVSDQELAQAVYFEAYKYGVDPKEHIKNYQERGMLPAVKMALIEEKLFNDLFSKDDKSKKDEEKGE